MKKLLYRLSIWAATDKSRTAWVVNKVLFPIALCVMLPIAAWGLLCDRVRNRRRFRKIL